MRMKDFWRLSLGCPVRRCDSGFIFDTLQLRKGHRGSSLCVQLCPLAPALGLEQPVHSRLWRGCGQRLDSPGWSHSPHTCIPSRLLHSQVSLSQALGRGLQAPLPKPPYGRGEGNLGDKFFHCEYPVFFHFELSSPSSLSSSTPGS